MTGNHSKVTKSNSKSTANTIITHNYYTTLSCSPQIHYSQTLNNYTLPAQQVFKRQFRNALTIRPSLNASFFHFLWLFPPPTMPVFKLEPCPFKCIWATFHITDPTFRAMIVHFLYWTEAKPKRFYASLN